MLAPFQSCWLLACSAWCEDVNSRSFKPRNEGTACSLVLIKKQDITVGWERGWARTLPCSPGTFERLLPTPPLVLNFLLMHQLAGRLCLTRSVSSSKYW